jgi:nicotinamide-nucleotide amidase
MTADIITIGDEILIGQIVDTNSTWMASFLEENGVKIRQITSISDCREHIITSLSSSLQAADVVFLTGGLGPTKDDVTKKTLTDFFDDELILDAAVLEHILSYFKSKNRIANSLTRAQALVPSKCKIIKNKFGTAPAMRFEKEGKIIVSMPGVPSEMRQIMKDALMGIKKEKVLGEIIHKTIFLRGIVESHLAEMIESWELALPDSIKLAYLPSRNCLKLRFSARGNDRLMLSNLIEANIKSLREIVGPYFSEYQTQLDNEMLVMLLKKKAKTISTAESCTGGNIAKLITSISRSSTCFGGSVVAYSERIKTNVLNVDPSLIEKYGVVSEEVVAEMAAKSRLLFGSDYSISTSGIAGPNGGTKDLPVGTICFAIASPDKVYTFTKQYNSDRETNISRVSLDSIRFLNSILENLPSLD